MTALYKAVDRFSDHLGRIISWLTLGMVLMQFVVVLQRYIFSVGSLFMQESIVYMHGLLIMLAGGYTLLHGDHVRIDIFYREASQKTKDLTNLAGSLVFLIPICLVLAWSAYPNVRISWLNLEGSTETSGIPVKYLLKSSVIAFALLLALQSISVVLKSCLRLSGVGVEDPYEKGKST